MGDIFFFNDIDNTIFSDFKAATNQWATLTFIPFKSSTPVTPVTYSVVNREVCRQEGTGIQRPMTDGKRNTNSSATLKFTRNTDGISIDIELTLTKADNKNRLSTENIKTTIFPLNNGNDN